jgi:sulfite exporter TauE/SafE
LSDLFHSAFWTVPLAVFIAGIVGSPHCLSMCGPLVVNFARSKTRLLAYQFGRMLAYTSAGAAVGSLGQAVLGEKRPLWLSSASMILIAMTLLFTGYRNFRRRPLHFQMPKVFELLLTRVWNTLRLSSLPDTVTAGVAGVLTVFLPCGHLYSFLIGAVATGRASSGALFMFAFWLGSTPLLSFGSLWLQRFLLSRRADGQRIAGVVLISAGLLSLLSFAWHANGIKSNEVQKSMTSPFSTESLSCHGMKMLARPML